MIAGTGSALSGCCGFAAWLFDWTGAGVCVAVAGAVDDGVALAVGAAGGGVAVCCGGADAFAEGAMACAGGRAAFLLSVLSHDASNNTATLKIKTLKRFKQHSTSSNSLPSYLCSYEVSRLRIGRPRWQAKSVRPLRNSSDDPIKKAPRFLPGLFPETTSSAAARTGTAADQTPPSECLHSYRACSRRPR